MSYLAQAQKILVEIRRADTPAAHSVRPTLVAGIQLTSNVAEDLRDAFEERAAIMEFDGGMSREEAEQYAAQPMNAWGANGMLFHSHVNNNETTAVFNLKLDLRTGE